MSSSLNIRFSLKSVIETLYWVKLVREQFCVEKKQTSLDEVFTEMVVVAAATKIKH